MDAYLVWLIAGFALVIAELLTGTFYLLVLGAAAFVGAAAAYFAGSHLVQAIAAAAVALVGVLWVHHARQAMMPERMRGLDVGQPAAFESWVDKPAGHARVKYRDALWDAHVAGAAAGEPGEILYVTSVDGNTLKVSKTRPA
ncbi:MAG TPA: NfeD family protein [Burkholderiales bacterium]|nr:NfeD family protein [Burkholderiales bacterium]